MSAKGYKRYIELFKHIQNPFEYIFNKGKRFKRSLFFKTKSFAISFEVPLPLYLVFKEIFMEDVYNIESVIKNMPQQPVIIDIGANAGFFDIIFLSKINTAKIYAYEPISRNIQQIKKLLLTNPAIQNNIIIHEAAVTGTARETIDLYIESASESSVIASVFSDFNKDNSQKISVKCITLSDIFLQNNLAHVDIMKIDCEGSEYDILYNTDPALIRRAKLLLLEVHDLDENQYNLAGMNDFLSSIGYDITHRPINNFCHAVEAVLKS